VEENGEETAEETPREFTGAIAMWTVIPTVALGFVNTILRYVGQATGRKLTNNAVIELQWYLFGIIFLVGFAYILKHQINVRVDFWYANQSQRRRAKIDFIGHWIGLIPFCLIGLWVSVPQAVASWEIWEQSPDADGLPRAPIKALLALSFFLLLIQAIAEQIKLAAVLAGHPDFVELEERDAPIRIE
jgi:TRAP-type mannitol/chloroaromatic compound transport system permease small subunit